MSFLGLRLGLARVRSFFSPDSVSNLVLWLRSSVGVNAKASAQFTAANTESLDTASTDFDKGNESFSMCTWLYLDTLPATSSNFDIMGQVDGSANGYLFYCSTSGGDVVTLKAYIKDGATTSNFSLTTFGAPSTATWYHVAYVYDAAGDLLKCSVNGAAFETTANSTGSVVTSANFELGTSGLGSRLFNGRLDSTCFYDKALTLAQVGAIYNSGAGVAYADITADMAISLVSWWELNELTGTRLDSVVASGNDLSDNNTVTSSLGHIVEAVTDGDSVYQWLDQSGNSNHGVQETFASQMVYDSDTPRVTGDGTADNLNIDTVINDVSSDTAGTWCLWFRPVDATPSGFETILSFSDTSATETIQLQTVITTGLLRIYCQNSTGLRYILQTDVNPYSDNTWVHLSVVFDAVSPVIYINGVAVAQTFTDSTDKTIYFAGCPNIDNARLSTLKWNSLSEANPFTGDIQQVEIYSDAKTASEIWSIYNYDKPV